MFWIADMFIWTDHPWPHGRPGLSQQSLSDFPSSSLPQRWLPGNAGIPHGSCTMAEKGSQRKKGEGGRVRRHGGQEICVFLPWVLTLREDAESWRLPRSQTCGRAVLWGGHCVHRGTVELGVLPVCPLNELSSERAAHSHSSTWV
jgi:hypothetical protein